MYRDDDTPVLQRNPKQATQACDPSPPELTSYEKQRDARVARIRQRSEYIDAKFAADNLYATLQQAKQQPRQRKPRQKIQIQPRESIPRSAKLNVMCAT